MPVTIHLVRHAHGYHNLSLENKQLPDPGLTQLGDSQCSALRARFHSHDKLTHLVASPMRRTLYTCLQSFGPLADESVDFRRTSLLPVLVLPEIQEISDSPCDTGSDIATLEDEFRGKIDFRDLPMDWNEKKSRDSPWEPTLQKLEERAQRARVALRTLAARSPIEDIHIAVVTHGGFLHFLTDDWHGIYLPEKPIAWENCECRSYRFLDPTGQDPDARIKETEESWQARMREQDMPSELEQRDLRAMYYRELERYLREENTSA